MPNTEKKVRILRRDSETVAHPTVDRTTASRAHAPESMPRPANTPPPSSPTQSAGLDMSPREEIEHIKTENLTGRQLRIARRIAQKNGLQVSSDLDAVRLLRKNGIDPFQFTTGNMLSTAAATAPQPQPQDAAPSNLPATVRHKPMAKHVPVEDIDRLLEVSKIQANLVRRRRRRFIATLTKLFCFILIPSILAGWYFYRVATPMYASYTEFVIQKSDSASAGGLGGLLSSPLLATAQDSVTVQGYLSSRPAMVRLNQDQGFQAVFQDESIDTLQRLEAITTNEDTYKVYTKHVKIGFDPTEGVIKMEVVTPSPQKSLEFSQALIGYAEEQVDQLTTRLRKDQMTGADVGYEKAEVKYTEAQNRVVSLQEKLGVLSPEAEISGKMAAIQLHEADLQQRQLELLELQDNPRPNKTKLIVLNRSIKTREALIRKLRNGLTQSSNSSASLARVTAELQTAQSQLMVRRELLGSSLAQLEAARVEANRQTRYLSMSVSPVAPDKAAYPKAFENTLLATLLFAGLYLMVSLTASILREQLTT